MEDDDIISKDAIFEVLSSGRRRLLLYHLYRRGGDAELRKLAEDAAEVEFGVPLEEDQIKRIYIAFYQTHVPKLEDVGFVSYKADEQHVFLEDDVRQIARVLPDESKSTGQWPAYYLLVAVVGIGIAGLTYMELGSLAQIFGGPWLAIILSLALIIITISYYVSQHRSHNDLSFLEDIVGN